MNYCYLPPANVATTLVASYEEKAITSTENTIDTYFGCDWAKLKNSATIDVSHLSLLMNTIPERNTESELPTITDDNTSNEVIEPTSSLDYISELAIEEIKHSEGLRLNAYWDVRQWAIGYGNSFYEDGSLVQSGDSISVEEADKLFEFVLIKFIDEVRQEIKVPVTKNQLGALVSFAYNLGIHQFRSSSTLRLLNEGNYEGSANAMLNWSRAGNDPYLLLARRQSERSLFLTPDLQ